MAEDRLSSLDTSFLEVETPAAHMHVGWAALFGPPEAGPKPGFEQMREHVGTRMARAPRYRQRLAEVPLGAADPVWVDDENFAIERHVHHAKSHCLSEVVDEVMSSRLPRDRPMWELWIADRLEDGRMGVVGKAHHSMVDGLATVELASLLLDPTPEAPEPEADGWRPATPPGPFALFAGGLANRASRLIDVATFPLQAVRHPRAPYRCRRARWRPRARSWTPRGRAPEYLRSCGRRRRCATSPWLTDRSPSCGRSRPPWAPR